MDHYGSAKYQIFKSIVKILIQACLSERTVLGKTLHFDICLFVHDDVIDKLEIQIQYSFH